MGKSNVEKLGNNVVLIGFMAVGKSTIAKKLSQVMGFQCLDTDALIEKEAGMSVSDIFAQEGEASFRSRENAMLEQLSETRGAVIATGGGIVEQQRNHQLLADLGYVVWLHCPVEEILERVKANKDRPLARAQSEAQRSGQLRNLLAHRKPIYKELSDLKVKTNEFDAEGICDGISQSAFLYFDKLSR